MNGPFLRKKCWHSVRLWKTSDVHRGIVLSTGAKSLKSLCLTNIVHRRRPEVASAVDDSTPGDPNLKGHAAPAVVLPPNGDSRPAARPATSPVMDAYFRSWPSCARRHFLLRCPAATYPLGRILRQPAPVSFSWKETGGRTTAASHVVQGFAAFPLVTIGVTNADVTSNSAVDDGAADQGMDCT